MTSDADVVMDQETARQLVKDIKDRRLVQVLQDLASREVRCHSSELYLRDALSVEIQRLS
jgi:hypothetical protein